MADIPLLIDFTAPSSLVRERHRESALHILGNGPPGTFVAFPAGFRISLPTDQIVFAEDGAGYVRVGFGGMAFVGLDDGRLIFHRVREVLPIEQLSPARSHVMRLDPDRVMRISSSGTTVWTRSA